MNDLIEIIKTRKSVRTFDGNTLSDVHRKNIEEYMKDIQNPFDIAISSWDLSIRERRPRLR